jgi:parallel beta-helix repeat protein
MNANHLMNQNKNHGKEIKLEKRTSVGLVLMLLFISMLTASWKMSVRGDSSSIYIKPDGSVDPPSAPIQRVGDRYTFMGNLSGYIFVQRDNILIDGSNCWLRGNEAGYGFDLTSRGNVTITNCTISNFLIGIHAYSSFNIFLLNNCIRSSLNEGLQIIASNESRVIDNNFTHNGGSAIWLGWSNENEISGNFVTDNGEGVIVTASSVIMRNNSISGNNYNFGVYGGQLSDFIIDVDTSNTINNKPIYYWVNKQGMEVPSDAGYVAVINSTSISAKNLTLANNLEGVLSCFTSNLTIQNVSLFNNYYGIVFFRSSYNTVTACYTETGYYGIFVQGSSNNSITRGRIANNQYGVKLVKSPDNRMHHNDFVNNVRQADTDAESTSVWDDGYLSGGNYWSDYAGVDLNSGPYQNVSGSDGIGDIPYTINTGNIDNYPLMKQWNRPRDNTAPKVENLSRTPNGDVSPNQEVTVTVKVTDTESGVKNVTLSYKLGNITSWTGLSMIYNTTTGLYETVVPGQPNATSISFKIVAFDNAENMATEDNAGDYYVYNVIPEHFTLIALLSLMAVSSLIVTYARVARKSRQVI